MTSPRAVVVVPTFRRPEMLRNTLASLIAQRTAVPFTVLIVENDAAGLAGQNAALDVIAGNKLAWTTIVAPRQGNVEAINAGFGAALDRFPTAEHFLMIDDDEIASPGWLELMVSAAETSGAGIVGGPVNPEFDADLSRGMRNHPVFWPIKAVTGPIGMIYGSGNCLIRRAVFRTLGLPAFDVAFNFLGGGDTDFFTRARDAGVKFFWQAEALVTEHVPGTRTRLSWIFKRGLRVGAINRRIDRKSKPAGTVLLKDAAIVALSPFRGARELVASRSLLRALYPLNVALGRVLAIGGVETSQYRASRG